MDRIPPAKLEELTSWGGYAGSLDSWGGKIPLARDASLIRVLVAGGAGKHSCWIPTFAVGYAQTRAVDLKTEICLL